MELFLFSSIGGISVGAVYGLIALSFSAIFRATGVINFAQGEFAMLGGYAGFLFLFTGKFHPVVGILAIIGFPLVAAALANFLLVEPLLRLRVTSFHVILSTYALLLLISGAVGLQTDYAYWDVKFLFGLEPLQIGPGAISPQYISILVAMVVLCGGYWIFLNRTRVGLALRALGINAEMASLLGVRLTRYRFLAWSISAVISSIAGFLVTPLVTATAIMGMPLLLMGFIAAAFGGFGRPLASVAGGLIIGLLRSLFATYVSSGNAELLLYALLIVVLAFRPTGLLVRGEHA